MTRSLLIGVAAAMFGGAALWAQAPSALEAETLRHFQAVLRLDTQIQKEDETSRQLKTSFDTLRNDPKAVERLAREKLRYAKPGETVIVFEEPTTNRSAQQ